MPRHQLSPMGPMKTLTWCWMIGRLGCAWRETDLESANRDTLIRHPLKGEYNNPLRIVVFNAAEG